MYLRCLFCNGGMQFRLQQYSTAKSWLLVWIYNLNVFRFINIITNYKHMHNIDMYYKIETYVFFVESLYHNLH